MHQGERKKGGKEKKGEEAKGKVRNFSCRVKLFELTNNFSIATVYWHQGRKKKKKKRKGEKGRGGGTCGWRMELTNGAGDSHTRLLNPVSIFRGKKKKGGKKKREEGKGGSVKSRSRTAELENNNYRMIIWVPYSLSEKREEKKKKKKKRGKEKKVFGGRSYSYDLISPPFLPNWGGGKRERGDKKGGD